MKKQGYRRTLERRLARELSEQELQRTYGGRAGTETVTCCGGCADD